eukprot:gene8354-9929_t
MSAAIRWDPGAYGGIEQIYFEELPVPMWFPKYAVMNSVVEWRAAFGSQEFPIYSSSEGHAESMLQVLTKTQCSIDVKHFPFDEQVCRIQLGSYIFQYHEQQLHPVLLPPHDLDSNAWEILDLSADKRYSCFADERVEADSIEAANRSAAEKGRSSRCYQTLEIKLHLKRKFSQYLHLSFIPVAITVAITFVTFMLPIGGGERTGLIITALLTVVAVMFITSEKLPETSTVTTLDHFYK